MSANFGDLRAAAAMAAESAELAIGRVIRAEKVIDAAIAYVDGIEREAPAPEMLGLTREFIVLLREYQNMRPS